MEADKETTEQNQKIPFHVYNYYLSEKNENQNIKEKSYYINKEDKEKVLQKIHYTELKKYLEKENCSEQSKLIEQYYKDNKIEPFGKEEIIDIITKNENCTMDNDKEEINEEFKKLVENIIGYKKENGPKTDNPKLPKTEENKNGEEKGGKEEKEKGNNQENKNKPIENEPDKKDEEKKNELNNNENREGVKEEKKENEKKEEGKEEKKGEGKEGEKLETKGVEKDEKKEEKKDVNKEEIKEEDKEGNKNVGEVSEIVVTKGVEKDEKKEEKKDVNKEEIKEEDKKDDKNVGEISEKVEIKGDAEEKKQEDQNQKEICQGNNGNNKNESLEQQTNTNPILEGDNKCPQAEEKKEKTNEGQTMNSPKDGNSSAEENVNNPKKEKNPEIKKNDNNSIEDKNNEKKPGVQELTQNEIHEKGKDENNQENQTENQNGSPESELNEQNNNPKNKIKKDENSMNLDENEEDKESKENKDITKQESTKKKQEVNEKKVNETTSDNINISDIKNEIKTSEDNPENLLQRKKTREENEKEEEGDTKKSKIEENAINNDEEKKKTDEIQQNNQDNQNNNNINEITPEMLLQFQQMQQQMINEYLLKNGYENKFVNDYYNLTQTQNEEPDYGLPQVKNGRIQLNPDINSIGLQNVGATCYMNATLECLIHIKELSEILLSAFFFSYPRSDETFASKHKLSLQYIDILSQVFFPKLHGNSKYFAPYEFKTLISEMNPLFAGIQANDAKDLLQFVLENLHSELKMATQFFSEYNIDQRDQNQAMQYFYNSYVSQNKSPIHDILYGVNKIESICLKCNTHKYNFQSYNLLYFPLKEAKRIAVLRKKEKDPKFDEKKYILTLEDCFAHSEQTELFTGDNQMYCNECHCLADAKYQTVLFTTPSVISIVLNRGRANRDFQEDFKFGLDLDIKEYIHNPNYKHGKYYLIGMVVHAGGSDMSGHFFAYCRMDKKAKWFCYNDAFVSECNDIEKKLVENKPYILFYHYDNDANQNNQ